MKKPIRIFIAVFLALGSMMTFTPRDARAREVFNATDDNQGIGKHFVAVWEYLSRAMSAYEEDAPK